MRASVLELDGRAVAFNGCLELDGTLYWHRLAFDPELSRFSPGLLCTLDTLEAAAADGLRRVEFLGGGEDYKLQLMDGFEPLQQALGLADGPRGRLYVGARLASISLRMRLRRSEAVRRLYVDRLAFARRR